MINMKALEELRTRREVKDYFKQLGKEITEEELDALKQNYDKAQENNDALTMQQLDDVAGGIVFIEKGNNWQRIEDRSKLPINLFFKFSKDDFVSNDVLILAKPKLILGCIPSFCFKIHMLQDTRDEFSDSDLKDIVSFTNGIFKNISSLSLDNMFLKNISRYILNNEFLKKHFEVSLGKYRENKIENIYFSDKVVTQIESCAGFFSPSKLLPAKSAQKDGKNHNYGMPLLAVGATLFIGSLIYTICSQN